MHRLKFKSKEFQRMLTHMMKHDRKIPYENETTDDYGVDGDFVESKAFAFLAIRSYKKLPITFPSTTNCNKPCTGGKIIEN